MNKIETGTWQDEFKIGEMLLHSSFTPLTPGDRFTLTKGGKPYGVAEVVEKSPLPLNYRLKRIE